LGVVFAHWFEDWLIVNAASVGARQSICRKFV
jgi:hypothetical protein